MKKNNEIVCRIEKEKKKQRKMYEKKSSLEQKPRETSNKTNDREKERDYHQLFTYVHAYKK